MSEKEQLVLDEQAKALLAAGDAAVTWWRSMKPFGWGIAKHLKHPTVNCTTYREKMLAKRASQWYAAQRRSES